jgi:PIN like domain
VSRSRRPPEFFVDRSLGRHRVPEALRQTGWTLRTHHEVYGERDEQVADVEWLEFCGRHNLPSRHESLGRALVECCSVIHSPYAPCGTRTRPTGLKVRRSTR